MLHMEHTTTAEKVAARVSQQIKDCGVQVTWLCERTGIPRSTMLRRLSGRSPFNLAELDLIATALRLPVTDLIGDAA